MEEAEPLVDSKLPYGNELKQVLIQSQITPAQIAKIMKSKGIFYGKREKCDTVPILCSTLLTPDEFFDLKEKISSKESSFKKKSTLLEWKTDKDLLSCIPEFNAQELFSPEYANYSINGDPKFLPKESDRDSLIFEYSIIRQDLDNSCWATTRKEFFASVEISKNSKNKLEIKVTENFTSKETADINRNVVNHIKKHFRDEDFIGDSENKVTFNYFSNEQRITFLWSLTGTFSDEALKFQKISDIDIKPDDSKSIPENLNIDWMAKKISRLHLTGELIHQTHFMTDKNCYPYLILWRMQAHFDFELKSCKGSCVVTFEFQNYSRKNDQNAELVITVDSCNLEKKFKHLNKKSVENELLDMLDSHKMDKFIKLSGQNEKQSAA